MGNDGATLSKFVQSFLASSEETMAQLRLAIKNQDLEGVRGHCHSLKGAGLQFGATPFVTAVEKVNNECKHDHWSNARTKAFKALQKDLDKLSDALEDAVRQME